MLQYKVERIFRLPDAGHLKAFCDVSINDEVVIRGVRVLEGKKGTFVSMPQEQGKDSKWYDQVIFRSASGYEAFSAVVLDKYHGDLVLNDSKGG